MMFRRCIKRLLPLIILIMVFALSIEVKADESHKLLILYDSYKEYGEDEDKLSSIIKATMATNNGIKIKKITNYESREVEYYKGVIILFNEENSINDKVIEDVCYYKGKCIFLGQNNEKIMEKLRREFRKPIKIVANDEYNGISIKELDNIAFIEKISNKDLSYFVFRSYILKNLGVNKDYSKNYLMIDKVYPITNLSEFMEKIDYLYDQGIKVIFSIMPVYENANLMAMRKYTEILRYAQSKGGMMFFHSADIYREGTAVKDVYDRMKLGYTNYINYHVYPVALDIPENWLYFEDYKMIFNKSNTIVIDKGKNVDTIYLGNYTLKAVENIFEKVELKSVKSIDEKIINKNLIFTIPNSLNFEEFKEVIKLLKDKDVNLSDPKHLNMRMEFVENEILITNINGIYLNNGIVDLKGNVSQSSIKEDLKQEKKNEGFSLKKVNSVIIIVTVVASVLFLIIAFVSRRIDRRKYFK